MLFPQLVQCTQLSASLLWILLLMNDERVVVCRSYWGCVNRNVAKTTRQSSRLTSCTSLDSIRASCEHTGASSRPLSTSCSNSCMVCTQHVYFFVTRIMFRYIYIYLLPCDCEHLFCDNCLQYKRDDYQNCVLDCEL